MVEQNGKHRFIDRVEVRFLPSETKYWASMENFGFSRIHVPQEYYRRYRRLLEGGIWAIVDVECITNKDRAKGGPFRIADLRPVQLMRPISKITQKAAHSFTTEEWMDVLLRSVGLEPTTFTHRLKPLLLARLIPFASSTTITSLSLAHAALGSRTLSANFRHLYSHLGREGEWCKPVLQQRPA